MQRSHVIGFQAPVFVQSRLGEELIGCHPEHLAAPWLSVHGGPDSHALCPVARPAPRPPPPAFVVFSPALDPPQTLRAFMCSSAE